MQNQTSRANLQRQEKMPLKKTQLLLSLFLCLMISIAFPLRLKAQRTQKPPLHGRHWMAITGKPLAATAGAMIFQKGGNAVDAACAMIAATATMWDTLSWGGETQALIYNPKTGKVIGINALGVAPAGATAEFYKSKGMKYPPEYGPLAAVTPGTPGGILVMLAEYGKLSLKDVLEPAIQMADGYPIEAQLVNTIEREKKWLKQWTQAPAMLQALNILENFDLKGMGYNSARYINTIYQAMNLAFADRDFYYGDPAFAPEEPIKGLLSKDYAKERVKLLNKERNDPAVAPGDPYPFQGEVNPYRALLEKWNVKPAAVPASTLPANQDTVRPPTQAFAHRSSDDDFKRAFYAGTTSVEAADEEGWVVSVTPSGGWVPAVIAGHTGVGLSQRAQSFVTDPADGPFNVIEPGKHPRVTLTPTLALQDGKPFLCFSVQGGDSQDQNLLQFFLNIVEFGMTVQEATEAANINSFQMRSSFGNHEIQPGRILLNSETPPWVRGELRRMGYTEVFEDRTSGPSNAIMVDRPHG